jgi:iron-sulfur cluster assembly accessory protein
MYVLDEVELGEPGDLELPQDGFVIYLDVASLPMIRGTELDFVFEGLNRVLTFNNPNVKAACGCGESFSVEDGVTYS